MIESGADRCAFRSRSRGERSDIGRGNPRRAVTMAIGLGVLAFCGWPAAADDVQTNMSARQLNASLTLGPLDAVTRTGSWEIHEFIDGGRAYGVTRGAANATTDGEPYHGYWRIDSAGRFCVEWAGWNRGVEGCHRVVERGHGLALLNKAGGTVWTYELPAGWTD